MQLITLQQIRELPRDRYNFIICSSNEEAIKLYHIVTPEEEQIEMGGIAFYTNNIPLIRVGNTSDGDTYCPVDVTNSNRTIQESILDYYSWVIPNNAYFYKYQPIQFKEL